MNFSFQIFKVILCWFLRLQNYDLSVIERTTKRFKSIIISYIDNTGKSSF
jgi:hypothetical protein